MAIGSEAGSETSSGWTMSGSNTSRLHELSVPPRRTIAATLASQGRFVPRSIFIMSLYLLFEHPLPREGLQVREDLQP